MLRLKILRGGARVQLLSFLFYQQFPIRAYLCVGKKHQIKLEKYETKTKQKKTNYYRL